MYKLAIQHKILFNWLGNNHHCIVIGHFNTALEIKEYGNLVVKKQKKIAGFLQLFYKNNDDFVQMSQ